MDLKKSLACCVLGFSLGQAFNVATNPLGNMGFGENVKTVVTNPLIVADAAVERPGGVLGPLGIAAAAGLFAFRRKKGEQPKP